MRKNRWVVAVAALLGCAAACVTSAQVIKPEEGAVLNRVHVLFQWAPIPGATDYEIEVVVDNGEADPFSGSTPVVHLTQIGITVRTVVTEGLAFGTSYAWHVRGINKRSLPWSPVYHFQTVEFPKEIPAYTIEEGESSSLYEPGLTLFNIRSPAGDFAGGYLLAVDREGDPIWFLHRPEGVSDARLLESGRLLFNAGTRGFETDLDGTEFWASPNDPSLVVHHEIFPMPNGNYLAIVNESQEGVQGGKLQLLQGDKLVEFDRQTNQIVWEWSVFDYYCTEDFDELTADWTHGNAVVYNAADNSVYFSPRNLSRITRIDYATGDIVYNMGFNLQCTNSDFGDNLFSFQHAPELLPNGNMMIFDNGSRRDHIVQTPETGISKAIELAFTGDPPTDAKIVWEWTLPEYNQIVGDADRQPGGTTLVTGGVTGAVYEVAPDGTLVWSIDLEGVFPQYLMYRAERIANLIIARPADINVDGHVDAADLGELLANWGSVPPNNPDADLNNDGDVGPADLGALLADWD